MDSVMLLDVVSVALTKWRAVVSKSRSIRASAEQLEEAIADTLVIEVDEVGQVCRCDQSIFKYKSEEQIVCFEKTASENTGETRCCRSQCCWKRTCPW